MNIPRADILEKEKTRAWVRLHFSYAENLISASNPRVARITRAYNGYNLRYNPKAVETLTMDAGRLNRTGFTAYPWARPKIDLINNEFLLRPLSTTVYTTNADAKSAKLDQYETLLGAVTAKKEINKLREHGVDPLEGMDIPDALTDDFLKDMSFKDMNEDIMQIIIDEQTKALDMKFKLAKCFQDLENAGEFWSRIFVDENGDEDFVRIDPRNRIAEEIEDDIFFERSPIMGHKELMPIHDVLTQFDLTKAQRDYIESQRTNYDIDHVGTLYQKINGAVCVRVIFLEWYGVEAVYTKVSPKTARQMSFGEKTVGVNYSDGDSGSNQNDVIRMAMPPGWFESNADLHRAKSKTFHEKRVKNIPLDGQPYVNKKPNPNIDYDVEVAYKEVAYRDILIGKDLLVYSDKLNKGTWMETGDYQPTIDSLDMNSNKSVAALIKKPFTLRRVDNKKDVYGLSYVGARFNVVNGETVSLYEIIDKFGKVLDNIMYKISQDLAGYKGISTWFNQDGKPGKKKITQIMYEMINDRFVAFSASAEGNKDGKPITPNELIQLHDSGFSKSFPDLISLKHEMQATLEELTGINRQRQGITQASETVTNAQSDKRASETVTEGLFYLMTLATERIFVKLCETTKLTWGLYKTEKAKIILGDKRFRFMEATKSIANCDYGVHLMDGGKMLTLQQQWTQDAQAALNAKTITFMDKVKFDIAPTWLEQVKTLEKAEERVAKQTADATAQQQEAEAKNVQAQIASQEKIAVENREDKQQARLDEIQKQGEVDIMVGKALARAQGESKILTDTSAIQQKALHEPEQVKEQQQDENAIAAREDQSAILQHKLKKDEITHQATNDIRVEKAKPKPVVKSAAKK